MPRCLWSATPYPIFRLSGDVHNMTSADPLGSPTFAPQRPASLEMTALTSFDFDAGSLCPSIVPDVDLTYFPTPPVSPISHCLSHLC
jgi:hypothetical protein